MFLSDNFIDIHTHKSSNSKLSTSIIDIKYDQKIATKGIYSCGIHPWDIENTKLEDALTQLMQINSNNKVIAIGEAGIDRAISTSYETQEKFFKAQLKLSEHYKKPVIVHCVKAYSDILNIRKSGNYKMPWIIHGFNASKQNADQLIKMNCYLSFGHALLDADSKAAEVFPQIPIRSIFLETDNSDISIEDIYEVAAKLRGFKIEQLKAKIADNANQCFNL